MKAWSNETILLFYSICGVLDFDTPPRAPKQTIVWLSSTTFFGVVAGGRIFFFFKSVKAIHGIIASMSSNEGAVLCSFEPETHYTSFKPVFECKQV